MVCLSCQGDTSIICDSCKGTRIEPAPEETLDCLRLNVTSAKVLRIGDRYFYGFTKTGRPKTAWSLAGAQMFMFSRDGLMVPKMQAAIKRLKKHGCLVDILTVSVYPGIVRLP